MRGNFTKFFTSTEANHNLNISTMIQDHPSAASQNAAQEPVTSLNVFVQCQFRELQI